MSNVPDHVRDNYNATDSALIRFNGLAYALEIVADDIPEGAPKSSTYWQAFTALMNELVEKQDTIMHLRTLEWVGLGGNSPGVTEAELARARGETVGMVSVPFLKGREAQP
jgi:hypothetical protein